MTVKNNKTLYNFLSHDTKIHTSNILKKMTEEKRKPSTHLAIPTREAPGRRISIM